MTIPIQKDERITKHNTCHQGVIRKEQTRIHSILLCESLRRSLLKLKISSGHQFIHRETGLVCDETLIYDRHIRWLYSTLRESAPWVFQWFTQSKQLNDLLAKINFDKPFKKSTTALQQFLDEANIKQHEMQQALPVTPTWRDIFCRKIRFEEYRPMSADCNRIVAPCDSRVLIGSTQTNEALPIKEKLFSIDELFGVNARWKEHFSQSSWAVFRLTPEMYHFNHCPVSGNVIDNYEISGAFHSCNPSATVSLLTPHSKNGRFITIFDTDCPGGSGIGKVAMVEVVALLIGRVHQCYSKTRYNAPVEIFNGLFCKRGAVKSVFEPGSSTVVLLFEEGRVKFDSDLISNQNRRDISSRFSEGFGEPFVETEVAVRSGIASAIHRPKKPSRPYLIQGNNLYELST
jgi:phosphatidylserine decarboxylase